jgi:maltodextrin utilization protein YvdJ
MKILNELIEKIIKSYFDAVFPSESQRKICFDPTNFIIDEWNNAGAYIYIKKHNEIKLTTDDTERVWSKIWFNDNNDKILVGVVLYTKEGYIDMVELFAPSNNLPDKIESFSLFFE